MPHRSPVPLALMTIAGLLPSTTTAQAVSPSQGHLGHVLEAFTATPDGAGLLPTAEAEVAIALRHAGLAANDPTNIDPMKQHTRHVLNAIDPAAFPEGPGLGFGVRAAADGIVRHIELAAQAEGVSADFRTHAAQAVAAAQGVIRRTQEIEDIGEQILAAGDYLRASRLVDQLRALCEDLTAGADVSGDGTISLDEGEGGLEQVREHVEAMAGG
jgi:hypothetical protein